MEDVLLDRLIELLNSGRIKRKDLARKMNVSQSTMGRWRNRECKPKGLQRERLEKTLDLLDARETRHPARTEAPAAEEKKTKTKKKATEKAEPSLDW